MRIAVNTKCFQPGFPDEQGYFLYETFLRITKNHPEHEFIFLFDRSYDDQFFFSDNVKPVVSAAGNNPLSRKIWFDIRLPALLKKYKADVFVSPGSIGSQTTHIPQCLIIGDLAFLHFPSFFNRTNRIYYKRYTPRSIKKAATLVAVSEFIKQEIIANYPVDTERVNVVFESADAAFHPLSVSEKQLVKDKYTGGREYFVNAAAIHPRSNLLNLLKAFSLFKQRQQTNIKLVLAGRTGPGESKFNKDLSSYKYRADVIQTGALEGGERARVIGAAYGLVYPSLYEGGGRPLLEAMRCEVPVITSMNSALAETAGDAAMLVDPTDHRAIAEKMMLLYKDEKGRKELIRKGLIVAGQYDWDRTAERLWQIIINLAV